MRRQKSKNNDNGGQLDKMSRRKFIQHISKLWNNRFAWKVRPTLDDPSDYPLELNVIETNQFWGGQLT